jgi:hypothetical protein
LEETERDEAVLVIQRYYKGYRARLDVLSMREEEALMLGMKLE